MNKNRHFVIIGITMTMLLLFLGNVVTSAQATSAIISTPTPIGTPIDKESPPGEDPSVEDQEELKSIVWSYIESRYRSLSISKSEGTVQDSFDSLTADTDEARKFLSEEMARMAVEIKHAQLNHLRYVTYKIFLDFHTIKVDPVTQTATILVSEGNEVVYEISAELDPENPIISRTAGIEHTIIFSKEQDQWHLVSDTYNDNLWKMLRQSGTSTDEILQTANEMLLTMQAVPMPAPALANSEPAAIELVPNDLSSHPYDRDGAVEYALNHWSEDDGLYNPNYASFPQTDCQNFVSQALYEGGNVTMYIPDPNNLEHGGAGWYYLDFIDENINRTAAAWTIVDYFYWRTTHDPEGGDPETWRENYNQGPIGIELFSENNEVPAGLMLGDIIQYDWKRNGTWDGVFNHTAIIVGFEGNMPFVAAHTTDQSYVPYNLEPDARYRFIHIERSNGHPPVKVEVKSGAQDAGQNSGSCINSYTDGNIYLGKCSNGTDITSGFQFSEVPIPSGATIKYAYITFTVDGPYTVDNVPGKFQAPIKLDVFGDPSGLDFSSSLPSTRTNLTSSVPWDISGTDILEYNHWEWKEKRTTPNVSSIVQQLVSSSWNYGDPLNFIFKNNSAGITEGIKVRRVMGYERVGSPTGGMLGYWSARLVAAYSFDGATGPIAPLVYSVTRTDPNPTNDTIVNFTVQFSEAVTGVDDEDFTPVMTGAVEGAEVVVEGVIPDPLDESLYTVQVNTGTGDGTIKLNVKNDDTGIKDLDENPLNGGFTTGESYTIDKTAPTITSFFLIFPNPTNTAEVAFVIEFDEIVTGADSNDFDLFPSGISNASITSVKPLPSHNGFVISVNTGSGNGTLGLALRASPASSITDLATNLLNVPNLLLIGTYTIDKVAPTTSSSTLASTNPTNSATVEFMVTFPESVSNVDVTDFTLATTGVFGATVSGVSGSGSEYTVTVDTGSGNGTIRLDIPVDASISDLTGNPLTDLPYIGGESYTVTKTTAPFEGDEFNGPNLAEGWQWYVPNPGPTYSLSAVPGSLRMTLPVGGYYEHWGADDYAPQLRHIGLDYSDWAIETRLDNINASDDAGYWAALVIGFDQYDQVWFGMSDNGYLQEIRTTNCCSISLPEQDVPIKLRVEKLGENYTFLYKNDTDVNWTELSTENYMGTPIYVGLIGRSWNTGSSDLEFDWSYFRIEPWFAPLTVSSVTRNDTDPTNADTVDFTVTFSEAVTGVDISDFTLFTEGLSGTTISNVSGSENIYTVTVQTGTGEGMLRLDVLDNDTILSNASRSLESGFEDGETYTVDRTSPSVTSIVRASFDPTNEDSVEFTIEFSENVTGIDLSDFILTTNGVSGATLSDISGMDNIYTVMVNTGTGSGTIRLDVSDDDTIVDIIGNPLGGIGISNGNFISGEVYTVNKDIVFTTTSVAAQDGYVLESTETSNTGGSVNTAATTFFVGDHAEDRQYRSLLSFATSGLPDDAVIVSATLKLKLQGVIGTNPFTTHNDLLVDIRQPYFGAGTALQIDDFAAIAGAGSIGIVDATQQDGYHVADLDAAGFAHINKSGSTQLRLYFQLDDNDDLSADYLAFYSANASASTNRPVLEIVYYIP